MLPGLRIGRRNAASAPRQKQRQHHDRSTRQPQGHRQAKDHRAQPIKDRPKRLAAKKGEGMERHGTATRLGGKTDPSLHFAFYEFPSLAAVEALPGSPALSAMIAEFDRVWGSRVTRSREILEFAGELHRPG